jgi:hypothetical protein
MHRSDGYEGACAGAHRVVQAGASLYLRPTTKKHLHDAYRVKQQAPRHTSARHTYCTAAVVSPAGWDTPPFATTMQFANQIPRLRPSKTGYVARARREQDWNLLSRRFPARLRHRSVHGPCLLAIVVKRRTRGASNGCGRSMRVTRACLLHVNVRVAGRATRIAFHVTHEHQLAWLADINLRGAVRARPHRRRWRRVWLPVINDEYV